MSVPDADCPPRSRPCFYPRPAWLIVTDASTHGPERLDRNKRNHVIRLVRSFSGIRCTLLAGQFQRCHCRPSESGADVRPHGREWKATFGGMLAGHLALSRRNFRAALRATPESRSTQPIQVHRWRWPCGASIPSTSSGPWPKFPCIQSSLSILNTTVKDTRLQQPRSERKGPCLTTPSK